VYEIQRIKGQSTTGNS